MTNPLPRGTRALLAGAGICATALLAGCASTQLDASWSDSQLGPSFLRGARVLVACDTAEVVVRQLCQDQLAGELIARGATPVFATQDTLLAVDRAVDPQLLPSARGAGAKALMVITVAPAVTEVSPGLQIGIGGFGYGRSSSFGMGVSGPVGGGRVSTGYSANSRLTDVSSGRLIWTAKATAPPSSDINAQLGELSKAVVGAADRAGLF